MLLTPPSWSCYHARFMGVKMETPRGLLPTAHSSISWVIPTSWETEHLSGCQGELEMTCIFSPSRFMPSFLRLGSWNVVMFVTYEQLKRALMAARASREAPF